MKVTYCDVCLAPISGRIFYVSTLEYREDLNIRDSYGMMHNKGFVKDQEKEICANCKKLIDDILTKRMIYVAKLGAECKKIYDTPTKEEKQKKIRKPKQ